MVNSRMKGIMTGLTLMYSLGCQNDSKTEVKQLELDIEGTGYTIVVNPETHYELRLFREILIKENRDYADFKYNSLNKTLRVLCVPDSTLNRVLSGIDWYKDSVLINEEVSNYLLSIPN